MRTKTFSAKRLLSLVLTVAMFATMILPTSVFASTAPVAVASAVDNGDGTITRKITISFFEEIDPTGALLGSTIYVDGKTDAFGTSGGSMELDANGEDIVITVGENYTVDIYDEITFEPSCIKYVSDDSYFDGLVQITGSFDVPLADFTALNEAIEDAEEIDTDDYTIGTVTTFEAALATAKAIDTATETNQTKVNDAKDALIAAMSNLLARANFTALNDAIVQAGNFDSDDYTVTSYAVLTAAVATANNIDQTNTSVDEQSIVDAATGALNDAINNLVPLANFDALNDAIEQAGHINPNDYTAASFAVLTTAVAAANNIDQTEESVQANVDNAKDAILTAIAGLVGFTDVTFTATAVADNVSVNYAKANKIIVVFGNPLKDGAEAILEDKINVDATVSKINNSVYVLELDAAHTLTNGITLEIEPNEEIFAADGKAINACSATVVGNLESAAGLVTADEMTATIVNVDDKPYMVNGDKIVLVFNAPVYDNPTTITVSGMVFTVVANTDNTVYERELDATTDSVVVGQLLEYGDIQATLKGTFGGTVVPEVVRALVEDVDGTAKTAGDKINVFFNTPTNKTAGTVENTFIDVLAGATGEWLDNQTLVITLGETPITINDKIDLSNLGIKDFYGTEDADADDIELEGSFGVAVQPALLTLTAISKQGKGAPSAGDEIYLAFNVKMREDALNLQNDFDFNYGDYGTGASVAWATGTEYAEYSTIIITLGEGANVVPGTTKITIEKELFEESGIKSCEVSNLENRIVTGTFGTSIAPSLISASIVKRSTEVGSQPGDQIVLLFNVPTNAADIINLISVAGGDLGNNVEEGVWSNNNTIYTITLGDGTAIANDTTITFTNTNGVLKDINNQKVASTKTLELNGSFGVEADEVGISPSSVTATIVKTTADAGAQAGDKIVFAFNVATNGVDLVNYFKSKGIYGNAGLTGGWSNGNTVYTLVLGDGATVTDTNVAEFTVEAGIKDANEINGAVTLTAGAFIGSFGATITPSSVAPVLLSATIVKGNGNTSGAAQAGDKVVFAFNMATNKADLFATLGGTTLFGSDAPVQPAWNEDGNIYTVTLGENATITDDSVLSISVEAGLKDKQAYSASAVINGIELIGSFGVEVIPVAPQPELLRVDIVKASADMGAQPGDKLRFIFNINTNEVADLISKIQQTLNGSTIVAFGENASGDWVEKNIYEITLGTNPNMQTGVKLVIPASAGIKDESGTSVAKEYTVNGFNGTFGESIAPEALSAVAFSDDGVDYIEVVFNVAVKRLADGIMIFENNSNFLGTEPYGEWMSDNIYRITLDDDFTITNTSLLHFNDTYKIYSKDGNAEMAAGSTIAVTGELRKPMVERIVAVNEGANGKIKIIFSSKTNGNPEDVNPIDLSSQSSSLGVGATSKWLNSYTLEITLGANRTISVGGGYIVLNGLGITNGFDNNEVVGQYFISEGELPEDELKAVDARVNERADGSYLTVIFNKPTDMNANIANVVCNKTLGTDATMTWETATKLVIKLGADTTLKDGKALAEGANVAFTNFKFANGLGTVAAEAIEITGSFDGRETKLDGLTAKVEGEFTVATVTLNKQDLDFGKNAENAEDNFDAIVTFVIWDKDGKLVTDMNSMNIDVNAVDKIELQSKFATKEAGKVDVYVTDTYIDAITEGTPAFDLLADTVTSSVAAQ